MVKARQVLDPDHFIQGTFYMVKLDEPLKGNPPKQVEIYDENTSDRFPMRIGVRYLLFAYEGVFEGVRGLHLAIDNSGSSGTLKQAGKVLAAARKLRQIKAAFRLMVPESDEYRVPYSASLFRRCADYQSAIQPTASRRYVVWPRL